ncbi:hypothetical protein BH10PAT2_BH10PAT2_2260 [soil metagenome]
MLKEKHLSTINVVVKYFYPINAGIEKSVLSTSLKLKKMGWKVVVHTSTDTLTEKNVLQKVESMGGIDIKRSQVHAFGFHPRFDWSKSDVISLHNFNIFPHFYMFVKTAFLKIIGKKQFILELTPHGGLNPKWHLFSQPSRFIKKLYHTTLGVWLINLSVDKVRAVSEWEAGEIRSIGVKPEKVVVIANGIEDIAFDDVAPHVNQSEKEKVAKLGDFIVALCRIDPVKNLETVIRALPQINSSVKFVILGPVGEMEYYESLKELAEKLLVSDRVIFYGEVSGYEKYYILSQAKAMVHMSVCESYCIAVREGMSQGLICVVADNSALKDFVQDGINGYKLDTMDWENLAKKINFILNPINKDDLKAIKRYNKVQSLENTWGSIASKLDSLYQQLTKANT